MSEKPKFDGKGLRAPDAREKDVDFLTWIFETYKGILKLDKIEGGKAYKKFMDGFKQKTFILSGVTRIQSYHTIKYGFPTRHAGYISATFYISLPNSKNVEDVNIGYCLWQRNIEGYAVKTEVQETIYGSGAVTGGADDVEVVHEYSEPEYLCMSPTYESKDGEYHHNLIWYKQFEEEYAKITELVGELELLVLNAIKEGDIGIKVKFYPDDTQHDEHGPMQFVDDHRLGIKALIAYFVSSYIHGYTFYQVHTVQSQVDLFDGLYKIFKPFCKKYLLDYVNRKKMYMFVHGFSNVMLRAQSGLKMIPLTVKEVQVEDDINYAPWRELYITAKASSLLSNIVTPGVPIFGNWTYLNGVNHEFLSNTSMKQKYLRSNKSIAMKEGLNDARGIAGAIPGDDDEFVRLDKYMYDSIDYIQESIELSNIVLCMVVEHTGFTMGSQFNQVINNSLVFDQRLASAFSNKHYQLKTLFELCYTANALHTKSGIVHGDLHINNMTILEKESVEDILDMKGNAVKNGYDIKNPTIAYIVSSKGEIDTYLFPYNGLYPIIIDYSRSILGESARAEIVERHGGPYAEGFYRSQVNRALRTFNKYLPKYTQKNQTAMKGLLYTNFEDMFKLLACVDFMSIGRNMSLYWKDCKNHKRIPMNVRTIPICEDGIKIGKLIENWALEHMMMGLSELVGTKGKTTKTIYFPGPIIMRKAFKHYSYLEWANGKYEHEFKLQDATLTDVYTTANDIIYDGMEYEKFPPFNKMDMLSKKLTGMPIGAVSNGRGFQPFIDSRKPNNYMEVIVEEVRRDSDMKPAAASSSWV